MEPTVYCRVDKSQPLEPNLGQMTPEHTSSYLRSISTVSSHLCLGLPSGVFPTTSLYSFLNSTMRAKCPVFAVICLIMLYCGGEGCKFWADHSDRSVVRTILDRSNTKIVGSNQIRGMDIRRPRFSVSYCTVQVETARWAKSPVKRIGPMSERMQSFTTDSELEQGRGLNL